VTINDLTCNGKNYCMVLGGVYDLRVDGIVGTGADTAFWAWDSYGSPTNVTFANGTFAGPLRASAFSEGGVTNLTYDNFVLI